MPIRPVNDRGAGSIHRVGDGFHELPVRICVGDSVERLYSNACILLTFVHWAQQRGADAVAVHARAYPNEAPIRPDQLLFCRQWTEIPASIDADLLCRDLVDINYHNLVRVVRDVECGAWKPPRAYTHWLVTDDGRLVGEARDLDPPGKPDTQGQHFCYVRLFAMPDLAEWGYTNAEHLREKGRWS